jgi:hypothetical protein
VFFGLECSTCIVHVEDHTLYVHFVNILHTLLKFVVTDS